MVYVLATALILLNALWLSLVVLGLPGTWLMVVSTMLVAWWQLDGGAAGGPMFSGVVLIVIVALALAGELLELFAGAAGSKQAGGSRRGAVGALIGALIGGIVGTIVIPIVVVGSLVGTCGGAAIGAWALELQSGRDMRPSLKAGLGAGVGRLAGTVAKLILGIGIWLIVAVAAFWP